MPAQVKHGRARPDYWFEREPPSSWWAYFHRIWLEFNRTFHDLPRTLSGLFFFTLGLLSKAWNRWGDWFHGFRGSPQPSGAPGNFHGFGRF